jgi:sporulation protein YlmC with PRC-barrel domain
VSAKRRTLVRVEDLLGKRVIAPDGRVAGRIEEIRADRRGDDHEVTEILLGPGALMERLSFRNKRGRTLVARWDQIDIRRPDRVTLTCPVSDLRVER